MKRRFLRPIAISLLLAITPTMTTGCFGSFGAVKLIYDFNASFSNKIVQWLVFVVAFFILPVYGIAGLIDVFFLNVLEFWTGSNMLAEKGEEVPEKVVQLDEDTILIMNRDGYETLKFELIKNGNADTFELEMKRDGAQLRKGDDLVGLLQAQPDGLSLYNGEGELVDFMSSAQEEAAIATYETEGAAGLVDFHEARAATNYGIAVR